MWWTITVLIALRAVSVFVFPMAGEGQPPITGAELVSAAVSLLILVSVSLGWAIVWGRYFRTSVRVRNTFGGRATPGTP